MTEKWTCLQLQEWKEQSGERRRQTLGEGLEEGEGHVAEAPGSVTNSLQTLPGRVTLTGPVERKEAGQWPLGALFDRHPQESTEDGGQPAGDERANLAEEVTTASPNSAPKRDRKDGYLGGMLYRPLERCAEEAGSGGKAFRKPRSEGAQTPRE